MKKDYWSQKEIDDIECAIYNDVMPAIYEDISQDDDDGFDPQVIKELFKDKEYTKIPDTTLVLSQDGRLFNYKTSRNIKPAWSGKNLFAVSKGKTVKYEDVFKEKGWEYNHHNITQGLLDRGFSLTVISGQEESFKSTLVVKDKQ